MGYKLGNFDTFFQLFAAIYIATTGYDTIIKRILKHIETKIKDAKRLMLDFEGTIANGKPDITDIFGFKKRIFNDLTRIYSKLDYLSKSYEVERSDLYRDLFIFNGLYLIIILIYAGIEDSQYGIDYLPLIIVNLFVLTSFLFLFRRTYFQKVKSNSRVDKPLARVNFLFIALFIFLTIIIHHVSLIICHNSKMIVNVSIQYQLSIKFIAILFSLILAVFSYLFFILRFLYVDIRIAYYNSLLTSPQRIMKKSLKKILKKSNIDN
jgi:hypothetical protein